jgi:hypothetical protein
LFAASVTVISLSARGESNDIMLRIFFSQRFSPTSEHKVL